VVEGEGRQQRAHLLRVPRHKSHKRRVAMLRKALGRTHTQRVSPHDCGPREAGKKARHGVHR
jgi:hypothetical protein